MCSAGKVSKVAYVLCFAVSSIRPFLTSALFISRFCQLSCFLLQVLFATFCLFGHKVTVVVASLVLRRRASSIGNYTRHITYHCKYTCNMSSLSWL